MVKRSFSIIGDSVSTFSGFVPPENRVYYEGSQIAATGVDDVGKTWWMRVIGQMGGVFLANASFSGSLTEGAGFPAACSPERVRQVLGPDGERPDVILCFMGINDFGWGGAHAQAEGRSPATPHCLNLDEVPQRVAGTAPAGALNGFARAYGTMLDGLRSLCPDAEIWCMTLLPSRQTDAAGPSFCYQLRGIHLDAYNDVIRQAAAERGMGVADVRALGFDYESIDGTHPTALGMEQIAAMTVSSMGHADFAAFRGLFPEGMRSAQLCHEDACVGCPFAQDAGNRWSCVCEKPAR